MMSYVEANAKLQGVDSVKLENNTELLRLDAQTVGVKLHNTVIVRYHSDGTYTLNSGGWRKALTRQRMRKYCPVPVVQERRQWYVGDYVFFDGIHLDINGRVLNADGNLKRQPSLSR